MYNILFLLILLLSKTPLFGMDHPSQQSKTTCSNNMTLQLQEQNKNWLSRQNLPTFLPLPQKNYYPTFNELEAKNRINIADNGFDAAFKELKQGNEKIARILFYGARERAKKHGQEDLSFLTEEQRSKFYAIIAPYDTERKIKKAIDLQKKGKYEESFKILTQIYSINDEAKDLYEDALLHGRGWQYNPHDVARYFEKQLKYSKTKQDLYHNIQQLKTLSLDGNMLALAVLAHTYSTTNIGLQDVLFSCQQYILCLTKLPCFNGVLPPKYFIIGNVLRDLCLKRNEAANTLYFYYNILDAQKTNDPKKITAVCSPSKNKNNPPRRLITKLLFAEEQESCTYIKKIKALTLNNKQLIDFYANDGLIAIPLLEEKLVSLPNAENYIASAIHYLLGLYRYHKKDYCTAEKHFAACTAFKHDFYLQCLALTAHSYAHATIAMHMINDAESLRQQTHENTKKTNRYMCALKIYTNTLNEFYAPHIQKLLAEKQYDQAYQLIYYLTCLPENWSAAHTTLQMIEQAAMAEPDEYRITLVHKKCRSDAYCFIEQLAKNKDHSDDVYHNMGQLYAQRARDNLCTKDESNDFKEKAVHYFSCALKHKSCPAAQSICANFCYDLAMVYNSLDYYNQAIEYGNTRALYKKALLLYAAPSNNTIMTKEIIDLLKKHADSNDPLRVLSLNNLADYYCLNNPQKSFQYLCTANELGNTNYALSLAIYYVDGIKKKNGEIYLEPDLDKALHYATQQVENPNKLLTDDALYFRATILYKKGLLSEAYADFKKTMHYDISEKKRITILWYMGIIKLHAAKDTHDIQPSLKKFELAIKTLLEFKLKNSTNSFSHFFDDETFTMAHDLTLHLITTQDTSTDTIKLCYILGNLIWQLRNNKPVTDPERMHAVKCLIYAADHGSNDAQWHIQFLDEDEISLFDKIYYLEKVLAATKGNLSLGCLVRATLNRLYPRDIIDQFNVIDKSNPENNAELIENFLTNIYNPNHPIIIPEINDTQATALIEQYLHNKTLAIYTQKFMNEPHKATTAEINAAFLSSSILDYSKKPKELIQSASILQKLLEICAAENSHYAHQLNCVKNHLGRTFYNLGCHCTSPLLQANYYLKSAENGNCDGMLKTITLWLQNSPYTSKITTKTIKLWLNFADENNQKDRFHPLLIQHRHACVNKGLIKLTLKENVAANEQNINLFSNKFLVNALESADSENEKFKAALHAFEHNEKNGPNQQIKPLKRLADLANPHPHACILVAMHFFSEPNGEKTCQEYMRKSILSGLIKIKNSGRTLFKDAHFIKLIFQMIAHLLIDGAQKERGAFLLKGLKHLLVENKVDIIEFTKLIKQTHNCDLVSHPAWK